MAGSTLTLRPISLFTSSATGPSPSTYTVQPGDTLWGISLKVLKSGNRWTEIRDLNRDVLDARNTLRPGMVLKLPIGATAPAQPVPQKPAQPTPQKPPSDVLQGLFFNDKFTKRVALTFDDGPHPVNTPKVLDILEDYGAKATFFVTGQNAERYPELIRRIVREGHTLGNHTWDHPDLAKLSPAEILNELSRTQRAVDKALGRHYELDQMRPPYGSMDKEVKDVLREQSDAAILWNVDSNDWRYKNDDKAILDNVFAGSSSVYVRGGVILFHDIHPQTVRVLDDVLERLKKEGFKVEKTDTFLSEKYGK